MTLSTRSAISFSGRFSHISLAAGNVDLRLTMVSERVDFAVGHEIALALEGHAMFFPDGVKLLIKFFDLALTLNETTWQAENCEG